MPPPEGAQRLNLLILGGTRFLGRHLVEAARAGGHVVTLFNRGSRPDVFPEVETLRGDRGGDLSALAGRRWDAAIDTNGYVPGRVRRSAALLAGAVGHYTFVSTVSVYAGSAPDGRFGEEAPLRRISAEELAQAEAIEPAGPVIGESYGALYGGLKALCEEAVTEALEGRALIVRPGLLVGPHDPTDRFTYWPARLARGGEVLAPGEPGEPRQLLDARDLARWMVTAIERGYLGIYNAAGPEGGLTMGQVLEACRTVTGAGELTWVPDDFLLARDVAPWSELPLWLPAASGPHAVTHARSEKALRAGLTFRPLAETVQATLDWDRTRPADLPRRAGLSPAREAGLLAAWRSGQVA